MVEKAPTQKIQALMAQEIFIKNELQKISEELIVSLLSSEKTHLNDLLTFAIQKASNAEEQLEVSREQITTLEEELREAGRALESYCQDLDACHHDMVTLDREIWELTFNTKRCNKAST